MNTTRLVAIAVVAIACVGLVSANPPATSSPAANDIERIKRIGQEWGDALIAADVAALDRILADDWTCISVSGTLVRKETVLANLKSGKDKLESFQLGPMDVQVVGNTAAVHGSVTEKRSWDGKDTSGQYLYMDLLEKRGNDWVVIRSAGTRVK